MNASKKSLKATIIVTLMALITVLHYRVIQSDLGLHILHRELYFLPIILAGFWFGLKAAAITAIAASLVYSPHVFLYQDGHGHLLTVLSQIAMFLLVGVLLGWLVDRKKRQQKEIIAAENLSVLGRAASTVGYEMQDLLNSLRRHTVGIEKEGGKSEQEQAIDAELNRLEKMVGILKTFVPSEEVKFVSKDLNDITEDNIQRFRTVAQKEGVTLELDLDRKGCPIMIDTKGLEVIFNELIKNAIEVSSRGQKIIIRTVRDNQFCHIYIEDQGAGIPPEHLPKVLRPFFTTKKDGTGLGLSICNKIITELGGKFQVRSPEGKGAIFVVSIPREINTQKMIQKIKKNLDT